MPKLGAQAKLVGNVNAQVMVLVAQIKELLPANSLGTVDTEPIPMSFDPDDEADAIHIARLAKIDAMIASKEADYNVVADQPDTDPDKRIARQALIDAENLKKQALALAFGLVRVPNAATGKLQDKILDNSFIDRIEQALSVVNADKTWLNGDAISAIQRDADKQTLVLRRYRARQVGKRFKGDSNVSLANLDKLINTPETPVDTSATSSPTE